MSTRIVGIDFGTVRIGIAVSDERKIIASPSGIVKATKQSSKTVDNVIEKLEEIKKTTGSDIEKIVIGMPKHFSGRIGFLGDEVNHFAEILHKKTGLLVVTWDERLTTVQAERSMREANMNRKKRSKIIDTISAVIILQSYLDFIGLTI